MDEKAFICHKCQLEMTEEEAKFSYLGNTFSAVMLRCPSCGQVFVPEEIVKGRMAKVEAMLESK